ncbi:transposase family protein [Rhizobium aquaticum]|uniref:transposase family protein n=1 Tax=Rhizobium aquaticum TaxID=1549636 RepID=UPI00339AE40E
MWGTFGWICCCAAAFSRRVQSRYPRRPADLPLSGRRVELTIMARRCWCDAVL